MEEKIAEESIKYSQQNPIFPVAFAFSLSILCLIGVLIWLYIKTNKLKNCDECDVKRKKDFYQDKFNESSNIMKTLNETNKNIKNKLGNVEGELTEHKLIMQNIAENQKETSSRMENMALIQNKQLTLIEVLLNKKE